MHSLKEEKLTKSNKRQFKHIICALLCIISRRASAEMFSLLPKCSNCYIKDNLNKAIL